MKKLLKLKEWLMLEEAASHLTDVLSEQVKASDLYLFYLDGLLELSIIFVNGTRAKRHELTHVDEAMRFEDDFINSIIESVGGTPEPGPHYTGIRISDDYVLQHSSIDRKAEFIDGLWDLPMFGNNKLEIYHLYQMASGGPEVTRENIDGIFTTRDGKTFMELQQSLDENEFHDGSKAQLQMIEKYYEGNNVYKGMNKEQAL
jgi:hypothetical protein